VYFASDNTSGVPAQILTALAQANEGYATPYGNDTIMARVTARVRDVFKAPEAAVYLVATGTAANSLSCAIFCPPWGAVFCHETAHIHVDECGAPEFYTGGAKLALVPGTHGKMTPDALTAAIAGTGGSVHGVQPGMVSITNVTEVGSVYTPTEIRALTDAAGDLPCHLDGARFANALVATGVTAAEMTWKAGIDVLSFGGTKNGLLGAEAVVIFDAAKAWEFELRRKRAGHLFSKHRYLSAQFDAYLQDDLWLTLAALANAAGKRLADGLARMPGITLLHPVQANMIFAQWPAGTHARLQAAGAVYYDMPAPDGMECARLVTSWSTTDTDVDAFLAAFHA
jgi:threonine aldolase